MEGLLGAAEAGAAHASRLDPGEGWYNYPRGALTDAWTKTLFNQFHDILPGSSIGLVQISRRDSHEDKHDPWSYINYILFIIKMAYREFEQRLGQLQSPKGEKTSLVLHSIDSALGPFNVAEIQNKCTNVSVDMVRRVLKNLRAKDQVECLGRGQNARWQKTAKWQLGNAE